jgi:hypothetical protein
MVDEAWRILQSWPDLQLERAEALAKQAGFLAAAGAADAEAHADRKARESVAILRDLRTDNWIAAIRLIIIGRVFTDLGLFDDAERLLTRAHDTLITQMGDNQEPVHHARAALAALFSASGRPRRAAAFAPADADTPDQAR